MVPYALHPFFRGRTEELQAITAALFDEKQQGTASLALCGDGGVGKTRLALEYAYLQRQRYRSVFWILAETRETWHAAYNDMAELLDLEEKREPEQRRVVEAVRNWLETNSAWLLILDGLRDPALLKDFLPSAFNGHVLITTRINGTGKIARRLRVKSLPLEQSSRLLLHRGGLWNGQGEATDPPLKEEEMARNGAAQLDCLPLALNLAGAYLAGAPCSLSDYLQRLSTVRLPSRNDNDESAERPSGAVLQTVSLSREKAAKTGSPAADLLSLCAFLAPDEIPESLLIACYGALRKQSHQRPASAAKCKAALRALQTYALLDGDGEEQILSMARELQAAWRSFLSESEERAWAERLVQAIGTLIATLDIEDWEAYQRLLPHAQACAAYCERWKFASLEAAWLLHHMGWYLHTREQYAEAQRLEEQALAIYRATVGNEHPSTAMQLNNLAITCEDRGKLNDAASLHMQALAIRRKVLGEEHLETAASLNNLALVYHRQKRLDAAAPLYRQALSIRVQHRGEDHPEIAKLFSDLARLSSEQGNFEEARALYQKALAIQRKVQGSRHPDTIALLSSLAGIYQAQDRPEEALHWYMQALRVQRKVFGPHYPESIATLSALATIYQEQGRLDEAAFWLQHALAVAHPPLSAPLLALETLARTYEQQEQDEKAETLYYQALAFYQRFPADSALDLARCSYNLALFYHDHRRDAEARPLLEQALHIWQEQLGADHPDTQKARGISEQLQHRQKSERSPRPLPIAETPPSAGLKGLSRIFRRGGHTKS